MFTKTGKELKELVALAGASRGCAIPPEEDDRAPWHFDTEDSDIYDDGVVPIVKIILYFEDEEQLPGA
jgi:hypothetical protein